MTRARNLARRYALNATLVLAGIAIVLLVLVSGQNSDFTHALANERTQSILRDCGQQNARHRATIRQLDSILVAAEKHVTAARRAQIADSRASTVLLINALEPYQNCAQVAAQDSRP